MGHDDVLNDIEVRRMDVIKSQFPPFITFFFRGWQKIAEISSFLYQPVARPSCVKRTTSTGIRLDNHRSR